MGALHEGHLSLVRAAKAECDCTVVSIYVNPSSVRPERGFRQVPAHAGSRPGTAGRLRHGLGVCAGNEEVYRPGHATWVEVGAVAEPLEGAFRPGHFRGVATIVLKLLNMVQPDAAYFGQKDFQQALVIRRMVADLDLPVAIRVCPIVREPDGLAMSSRNRYLSPAARQRALVLWKQPATGRRNWWPSASATQSVVASRMRELIQTAEDAPDRLRRAGRSRHVGAGRNHRRQYAGRPGCEDRKYATD